MSKSLVLDGAVYEYADREWEQLWVGEADAPVSVLRYIIRERGERVAQLIDEWSYLLDMNDELRERIRQQQDELDELKRQQALGWESKPAKAKRKKRETV